jgi:hypothetical protein
MRILIESDGKTISFKSDVPKPETIYALELFKHRILNEGNTNENTNNQDDGK